MEYNTYKTIPYIYIIYKLKMSVIVNDTAQALMTKRMKQTQRVAFAGSMGSGKSFAAEKLKKIYGENTHILSLATAIKNLVFGNDLFDNRDGYQMVGTVGRTIDPESWVSILGKQITTIPNEANIIVDDVRYENEIIALHNLGFKIIYMDTPWDVRLIRIQKRLNSTPPGFNDFVGWFTHESEVQLMDLPQESFDHVIKDRKGLKTWLATFA